jgi:hypothetical protein
MEATDMTGDERQIKRHETCVKALQFELDLFWKRSIFFWGFIGAAFVAFTSLRATPSLQVAIASFGFVCSVVWSLVNLGSKFWYENWENKLKEAEKAVTGVLYGDEEKKEKRGWLEGKRFSPSKLAIGLSYFVSFLWFCLIGVKLAEIYWRQHGSAHLIESMLPAGLVLVSISYAYCLGKKARHKPAKRCIDGIQGFNK